MSQPQMECCLATPAQAQPYKIAAPLVLPPERPAESDADRIGVNRVNEHTLDMRPDRESTPKKHHHGPVQGPGNALFNHTETAVILPRSVYNLPEVDNAVEGHAVIYRNPTEGPSDNFTVPVRPGSIVVTPATRETIWGHCFENDFAMLVAIPGFVAPGGMIEDE